ncbi:MAG TPA: hypothetical protein VII82_06805 [Polyangiaceae bacterium]|jgi:hypothetical protein
MSGNLCVGPLTAIAVAALLVGCVADSTSSSSGGGYAYPSGGSGGSSSGGGLSQPLLADIDTNGQLVLPAGGQGIGVYVTYDQGGHWTVSWTCDTAVTNLPCPYVVDASVAAAAGSIDNAMANPSSSTAATAAFAIVSAQEIRATTTTTTGIDAMTFDTTPGAIVTVSVQLDTNVSFFFVQDNQVNGGYTGALTNPMMFKPSAP